MTAHNSDHHLDFFVIGAQKCATSWMFYCLNDHPGLRIPEKKIEIGYIGGEMFQREGEDWFFNRFPRAESGQITGDVSVDYLYDTGSPEAIAPYVDQPRFIASLRHPVDRFVSSYYWLIRRGKLPNLPLEKGIEEVLDQAVGFPEKLGSGLEEAVRRGCYGPQLNGFIDRYGPQSMLVLPYEEIDRDALSAIQKVYGFLGVDAEFVPPSLQVTPKKNTYNRALLVFERLHSGRVFAKVADYANQFWAWMLPPRGALSPGLRKRLQELYQPRIDETREVLMHLPAEQRPDDRALSNLWNQ